MIKLHEIIKQGAKARAIEQLGEERYNETPSFAKPIEDEFKAGAEFVLENILALPNQFPLVALVAVQQDPNNEESHKVTVKTSGYHDHQLVSDLLQLVEARLQANNIKHVVILMPEEEAQRRKAFLESLAVIKQSGKLKLD